MVSIQYLKRHISSQARPAGFWLRAFAHVFDGLAIGMAVCFAYVGYFVAFGPSMIAQLRSSALAGEAPTGVGALVFLFGIAIPFLVWGMYHVLFECSSRGATPGKLLLGIRVCDYSGEAPTFGQTVQRTIWKQAAFLGLIAIVFVSLCLVRVGLGPIVMLLLPLAALAALLLGVVGYLLAGITSEKRALHDMMADCSVVLVEGYPKVLRAMFAILAILVVAISVQLKFVRGASSEFTRAAQSWSSQRFSAP